MVRSMGFSLLPDSGEGAATWSKFNLRGLIILRSRGKARSPLSRGGGELLIRRVGAGVDGYKFQSQRQIPVSSQRQK